jgi:hypothetical protein
MVAAARCKLHGRSTFVAVQREENGSDRSLEAVCKCACDRLGVADRRLREPPRARVARGSSARTGSVAARCATVATRAARRWSTAAKPAGRATMEPSCGARSPRSKTRSAPPLHPSRPSRRACPARQRWTVNRAAARAVAMARSSVGPIDTRLPSTTLQTDSRRTSSRDCSAFEESPLVLAGRARSWTTEACGVGA